MEGVKKCLPKQARVYILRQAAAVYVPEDISIICLGTVCNLNNSRFILNAGTRLKSYTGINLNFELEKQVAKIFGKSK